MRVYAGDWRRAHRLACAEYADAHTVQLAEKRALVVVSAGGAPHDLNLIQRTRLWRWLLCLRGGRHDHPRRRVHRRDGRADFLKWFDAKDAGALGERLREAYEVNGQTAWSLLTKTERFRVHLVSALPAEDVRRMRMHPSATIEEALAQSGAGGYVMPRGAALMPFVAGV